MELKNFKAFVADDKKAIDEINHRILFTIPDTLDRDLDIVPADVMFNALNDKENFAANPIAQPCHLPKLADGKPPCVGSWDVENAEKKAHSVEAWLNFAVSPHPEEFKTLGDHYWWAYKNKHMRAVSINYDVTDCEYVTVNGRRARKFNKMILYDISCVPVGENQGALSKYKEIFGDGKEICDASRQRIDEAVKKFAEKYEKEISDLKAEIQILKEIIIPDSDELAKSLLLDPERDDDPAILQDAGQNRFSKILELLNDFKEMQNGK